MQMVQGLQIAQEIAMNTGKEKKINTCAQKTSSRKVQYAKVEL